MSQTQYGSWSQPRCLVDRNAGDGSIGINTATLEALSHVTDALDVVCILGGYRTGKSYLMNWLATASTSATFRNDAALHGRIFHEIIGLFIIVTVRPIS